MRSARRVVQAAGAATVAVIALAGCSAGQVAETALLKAPISGLNTQSPDGMLLVRNLQVVYNSPTGYEAGGTAPIELSLFNQSQQTMTVTISSRPAQAGTAGVVSAQQIEISGGAAAISPSANPEPSGSRPAGVQPSDVGLPTDPSVTPTAGESSAAGEPSASAASATPAPGGQPAKVTIPPLSSAVYMPGSSATLQATGLSDKLVPGYALSLVIQADTVTLPLEVLAPFATPLSPASRAPGIEGENSEE